MGNFIISLDFELYWGVRAKKKLSDYSENLLGSRKAIPRMLHLFKNYGIAASFAAVGFMFFRNKPEWIQHFPDLKPTYDLQDQSPYTDRAIEEVTADASGIYHFAPDLIHEIKRNGHEIGTHTFSHFFCQEKGQTPDQFRADIKMAVKVAANHGIALNSIVFPRNQYTPEYLNICKEENIYAYRGNPKAFYYAAYGDHDDNLLKRLCRFVDIYINLSGYNCYPTSEMLQDDMVNIPASMFLRPYMPRLSFLEPLKIRRIKNSMTYAAKNNLTYHLWWHPHNFGKNIDENIAGLREILEHYRNLSGHYPFRSVTMQQLADELRSDSQNRTEVA